MPAEYVKLFYHHSFLRVGICVCVCVCVCTHIYIYKYINGAIYVWKKTTSLCYALVQVGFLFIRKNSFEYLGSCPKKKDSDTFGFTINRKNQRQQE
jgi:hypothetical protein